MKKIILGLVCGAVIASTIALAASYVAEDASFKVFVNGKEFTSSKAIVIDGSTYLPLRAIGEVLNVPVNWNEGLHQVEVGNQLSVSDTNQAKSFDLSMEEKNAIKKAESYLSFTSFSRSGLIKQLEFEGFSHDASVVAVDNINVDWNEQAAKKAESYLSFTSFSRSGLMEQLEFEGFTKEQAEYGVTSVGY